MSTDNNTEDNKTTWVKSQEFRTKENLLDNARNYRQRMRDKGLRERNIWVKDAYRDELKRYADWLNGRDNATNYDIEFSPLRAKKG